MEKYFILILCGSGICLAGALYMAFHKPRSEAQVTIAAILGGLALFGAFTALSMGYFMV